jgi:hypothetical protein
LALGVGVKVGRNVVFVGVEVEETVSVGSIRKLNAPGRERLGVHVEEDAGIRRDRSERAHNLSRWETEA